MSLLLPPANRHVPVTDDKYLHATDDEMRGRYLRSFSRVVRVKKKRKHLNVTWPRRHMRHDPEAEPCPKERGE